MSICNCANIKLTERAHRISQSRSHFIQKGKKTEFLKWYLNWYKLIKKHKNECNDTNDHTNDSMCIIWSFSVKFGSLTSICGFEMVNFISGLMWSVSSHNRDVMLKDTQLQKVGGPKYYSRTSYLNGNTDFANWFNKLLILLVIFGRTWTSSVIAEIVHLKIYNHFFTAGNLSLIVSLEKEKTVGKRKSKIEM